MIDDEERERLEADEPGAPPGYLLDPHDQHAGNCQPLEQPPPDLIGPDKDEQR